VTIEINSQPAMLSRCGGSAISIRPWTCITLYRSETHANLARPGKELYHTPLF